MEIIVEPKNECLESSKKETEKFDSHDEKEPGETGEKLEDRQTKGNASTDQGVQQNHANGLEEENASSITNAKETNNVLLRPHVHPIEENEDSKSKFDFAKEFYIYSDFPGSISRSSKRKHLFYPGRCGYGRLCARAAVAVSVVVKERYCFY